MLAEHFQRGHTPERAISWFRRAAEEALDGDDLEGAINRAGRAITCGAEGRDLGSVLLVQCEASLWKADAQRAHDLALEAARCFTPGTVPWLRAATTFSSISSA